MHTFKYSIRQGTTGRADGRPGSRKDQAGTQHHRTQPGSENKLKYRQHFIGKTQTVLVEKVSKSGIARGYGEHYVPVEFRTNSTEANFFEAITFKSIGEASQDYVLKG